MTELVFDTLPAHDAREVVRRCADVPRWCDALVALRPFGDADRLLATARGLARAWTPAEVEGALAQHPRIGERPAGDGAEARMSAREQAGVSTDTDVAARLRAGNLAYERRFGRVFLIRAAGRDAHEILAALETRLGADDETEAATTAAELCDIALLRLAAAVAPAQVLR
ncbi:2-oxo-4-hydroxy-4-carboxy-5-ureidoimidazoline decarboxylase [Sediminihabitans luteus]|uniref:2-oxo-4-hydroxy-4-carboxy-5-ureidoimidazoline decarboxylase n=1 Tax=Sediminihabitans luteus TaxID=1138585 RepID=A0A2M9CYP7_9CELL|nr:2-oxo-4-hydroxy-4-carboxy-5-ureidoimidazoline decarboxylase [Sediminihabitans luteus]PJJ76955.1 2-oxo-4-hydroxy-4-carboxy-5-ureidoimidazoline decarboxylase [Sediminihabitans luteus]GII99596.1 OHCU decarboxylase [Sediminihabitans luteus]